MTEEEFRFEGFTEDDFKRCRTGKKKDAKYLQNKFKNLMEVLRPLLQKYAPVLMEKLWVPRINIHGTKKYRRSMWVGTSHPKYLNPREGIQIQFYMNDERFLWEYGGRDLPGQLEGM